MSALAKAPTKSEYLRIKEKFLAATNLKRYKVQKVMDYLEAPLQWENDWALCRAVENHELYPNVALPPARYGITVNNAAESYNNMIRRARFLPIQCALDTIIRSALERYGQLNLELINNCKKAYNVEDRRHGNTTSFLRAIADEIVPGRYMELFNKQKELMEKRQFDVVKQVELDEDIVWSVQRYADGVLERTAVKFHKQPEKFTCMCRWNYHYGKLIVCVF